MRKNIFTPPPIGGHWSVEKTADIIIDFLIEVSREYNLDLREVGQELAKQILTSYFSDDVKSGLLAKIEDFNLGR